MGLRPFRSRWLKFALSTMCISHPADGNNPVQAAIVTARWRWRQRGLVMADQTAGDEHDEYDTLLASLGRTEEQDQRIAIHEIGHFLANSLIGKSSVSAVSITPGDGFEGICWGQQHSEAFVSPRSRDAASIRELLQSGHAERRGGSRRYCRRFSKCSRCMH